MYNGFEVDVEMKIAQERYRILSDPNRKPLKSASLPEPRLLRLLAWTGRLFNGLGCSLQKLAGEPCV